MTKDEALKLALEAFEAIPEEIEGWNGLNPEPPPPPTPMSLKAKAKYKSMSAVCAKKKQSKTVKEMCKRWEEQQNA